MHRSFRCWNGFGSLVRRSEAVQNVCERLRKRLGFQKQSVQNQVEHIEAGFFLCMFCALCFLVDFLVVVDVLFDVLGELVGGFLWLCLLDVMSEQVRPRPPSGGSRPDC